MSEDDYVGRTIGQYRIERKIGEGGMGAVYFAVHVTLEQERAFKVLPDRLVKEVPEFVDRFLREGRAAASVDHVNVVRIHDAGQVGSTYYLAQEFVRGSTLADRIKERGAFPQHEAVEIVLQAARGLAAAETRNVIHRDIKPANLMITGEGVVKVADFGLAKNLAGDTRLTMSGQVMGTPSYMSPEQAEGLEVDFRTDIYSLGVTLFEIVTGKRPYEAPTPVAMLRKHCDAPVPDPASVSPSLHPDLSALIRRMMAKAPGDRFPSHESLVNALENLLATLRGDGGGGRTGGRADAKPAPAPPPRPAPPPSPKPPGPAAASAPGPAARRASKTPVLLLLLLVAVPFLLVAAAGAVALVLFLATGSGPPGTGGLHLPGEAPPAPARIDTPSAFLRVLNTSLKKQDRGSFFQLIAPILWGREAKRLWASWGGRVFAFAAGETRLGEGTAVLRLEVAEGVGVRVGPVHLLKTRRHGWLLVWVGEDGEVLPGFLDGPPRGADTPEEALEIMDRSMATRDGEAFRSVFTHHFWAMEGRDMALMFEPGGMAKPFTLRVERLRTAEDRAVGDVFAEIEGEGEGAYIYLLQTWKGSWLIAGFDEMDHDGARVRVDAFLRGEAPPADR